MQTILYSLTGADTRRHYSPHVWKIILALLHKGLEFELRAVSFDGIAGIEDGSFRSVPVLNDRGHIEGDSFAIALYLEQRYADRPSLFGGAGGIAMARFVEAFSKEMLHPPISAAAMLDMHAMMSPADQAYFRAAREKRFGKTLEALFETRHAALADLPARLTPLRAVLALQPWFGGERPLFADYILFGVFQWARVCTPEPVLSPGDPVHDWFERCLDLHGAVGRSVPEAEAATAA